MRRTFRNLTLIFLGLLAGMPAMGQLAPGDTVFTTNGATGLIVRSAAGVERFVPVALFPGSPVPIPTEVLWHPDYPQSLFVGGNNAFGRLDFDQSGATTWTTIAWARGVITDLGVLADGRIGYVTVAEIGAYDPAFDRLQTWYTQTAAGMTVTQMTPLAGSVGMILNQRVGLTVSRGPNTTPTPLPGFSLRQPWVPSLAMDTTTGAVGYFSTFHQVIEEVNGGVTTRLAQMAGGLLRDGEMFHDVANSRYLFLQRGLGGQVWMFDQTTAAFTAAFTLTMPSTTSLGSELTGIAFVGTPTSSFETNDASVEFLLNGQTGTASRAFELTVPRGSGVVMGIQSALPNPAWELAVTPGAVVARGASSTEFFGGEMLNLDVTRPGFVLLNGGFQATGLPWSYAPTALPMGRMSAQAGVLDPAQPGGLSLSGPLTLTVQ